MSSFPVLVSQMRCGASQTQYFSGDGGQQAGGAGTALDGQSQAVWPIAGNVTAMYVRMNTGAGAGTSVITLYKNGSSTGVTATIAASGTTASFSGSVAVSAGDYLAWGITNNSGSVLRYYSVSMIFTPSNAGDTIIWSQPWNWGTNNYYGGPCSPGGVPASTFNGAAVVMPCDGTVDKLYVRMKAALAGGKTFTVTLYKNGSSTGLTCTVAALGQTANDTTNSVSFVAGDRLAWIGTHTDAFPNVAATVGMRFSPSGTRSGAPFFAYVNTGSPAGVGDYYYPIGGGGSGNSLSTTTDPNDGSSSAPRSVLPGTFYMKSLFVHMSGGPGASKSGTIVSRQNGADGAMSCALAGAGTGAGVNTQNDVTHSVTYAQGDQLNIRWNSTTAANTGITYGSISFTLSDTDVVQTYNQSVTTSFRLESLVNLPGTQETTINASYSKLGLGGRQMVRIGSRIYAVAVDSSKTYVVYSDNEAESWTSEQIVAWPAVGAAISQGAGSQPVLALTRGSVNKVYTYLRASTGSWTAGSTIGTNNSDAIESFQILYDNTNYHLLYAMRKSSDNSRNVYHKVGSSMTSWATSVRLDDGDNSGTGAEHDRALAACLDKDGDIHLVYCQVKTNRFYLRYQKYASAAWSGVSQIEDLGVDSSSQNRCIHLSIVTDSAKTPFVFGVKWVTGVQQVFAWSKPSSTWVAEGALAAQGADQGYPSAGMQNLTIPSVVFAGDFSDGRIHYLEKRNGVWSREVMSDDFTNDKPDQVYDPFRKNSQTLEGSFVTVSGSIDVIVTTVLVWGDQGYSSGQATFSQTIQIKGRDKVTTGLSFSQVVALSHAYGPTVSSLFRFISVVLAVRDMPRTVTKSASFSQNIGLTAILSGITTYYKDITHSLVFDSVVPSASRHHVQEVTHTLTFSQVGPGLTRYKSVSTDIEFAEDNTVQGTHNRTASNGVVFQSVPFLNKTLNLGVTHSLVFASAPVRVRSWVWNSTHFDPAWAAEYESQVSDFIIMGPDEAPTLEITLPKPDMDDENELFRRDGAIRRNRTGSAKSFVVPVYQTFRYQWSGFLRKRAEELRSVVGPLLGKNVRIRDHNGVWHHVKIVNTRITAVQKSPEYVVMGLEFEKNEAVY